MGKNKKPEIGVFSIQHFARLSGVLANQGQGWL
jgi:hypothetical protein